MIQKRDDNEQKISDVQKLILGRDKTTARTIQAAVERLRVFGNNVRSALDNLQQRYDAARQLPASAAAEVNLHVDSLREPDLASYRLDQLPLTAAAGPQLPHAASLPGLAATPPPQRPPPGTNSSLKITAPKTPPFPHIKEKKTNPVADSKNSEANAFNESIEDECIICMESLGDSNVWTLSCNHAFHRKCVDVSR